MAGTPVTSFKKAYIESALGDKVEAWFNPKEFSLTRTNKWTMKAVSGQAHPPGPQFGGSEPQKVSIDLLFDDSDSPNGDVTKVCSTLLGMMDAQVKVEGSPLDAALAARIIEVKVEDNLLHPDAFVIRIDDPQLEHMDSHPLSIGAHVEILFEKPGEQAESGSTSLKSVLKGQVTALEPEFTEHGVVIVARGYDGSHSLNR